MCGTKIPKNAISAQLKPKTGTLGTLIGGDLRERFQEAGLEAAGQRRNVTILFVDITGYTALSRKVDDEEVFYLIRQYLEQLAEDVYRYEGIVDKFTGDGLMAIFGAPIAYENNAERAVRAALDMLVGVGQLRQLAQIDYDVDLQVRIGLNAGEVVVGGVGSDVMMDYTAIGDTVNFASRLEGAAQPGSVYVSDSVYRQTKAIFDYDPRPSLTLKGYMHPVTAYRLTGVKRSQGLVRGIEGLRAPMIGRDLELKRLTNILDALLEKHTGQFAMVVGEAGLGKSRLTREFKAQIQKDSLHQFMTLEGQSLTYRRAVSYWLFQDVVKNTLGIQGDVPDDQLRTALRHRVEYISNLDEAGVLPFLEHLLALEPSDKAFAERIQYLEPGQLRQQVFLAVRDFLVALSLESPLILILEDLHWADDASLSLLNFLLDAVAEHQIFIYGITRPFGGGQLEDVQKQARQILRHRYTEVRLQTLLPIQSEVLLKEMLANSDLPDDFRTEIVKRSAGIPFYLEEMLRMLIDNKIIYQENDTWRVVEGMDPYTIGVPDTLEGLILTRFDRLDRGERRVLQVASVIGREFDLKILTTVVDQQGGIPLGEGILADLVAREYILPVPTQTQEARKRYNFKHVLTSDAIYKTILSRDREQLHGLVGNAIETLHELNLENQVELLADHFLRSPYQRRALHYLILAGQKAARDYANEQARQQFELALSLLPNVRYDPAQVLEIQMGLGSVLTLIGEYQAARTRYRSALEAVAAQDPQKFVAERSELHRRTGITFEQQGDFDKALISLGMAEAVLDDSLKPMSVVQANILSDIGWIHFRRGDIDTASELLNKALSLVIETEQLDVIASIYNRLGGVAYQRGDLVQASEFTRQSLEMRSRIGDNAAMARSYNNLGLLAYDLGEWDTALENYQECLDLQTRIGDAEALAFSYTNIAILQIDRGEFDIAKENLRNGLEYAEQIGAQFHIASAKMAFGRISIFQKKYVEALSHLDESLRIFNHIGGQEGLVEVYHLMGEAYFGNGAFDLSRSFVESSLELLVSLGRGDMSESPQYGRAQRLLGKIAIENQNWKEAREKLETSQKIFWSTKSLIELGRTEFELGRMELMENEPTLAKNHLNRAQKIANRLGARHDLASIERLLGEFA